MSLEEDLITIGKIIKPIGLHGEVKVTLLTDFPERFNDLQEVMVKTSQGEVLKCNIKKRRFASAYVYLTFETFTDRSGVEFLRGGLLLIPESERVELPEGSYFHSDLIGMNVCIEGDGALGEVIEILETGSNDILVVKRDGGESLIPAIKRFVKKVDLDQNLIWIDPIEGLLDL